MINDLTPPNLNQPSRNDLLSWINNLAQTNYTKIEQLGSGIAYCQILDLIQSNKLPMNKVSLKAKAQYQFINNFKVIQQCFSKMGVYKNIQIQKLVKCKYQDNLEFLQWFHKYFEAQFSSDESQNHSLTRYQRRSLPKKSVTTVPSPLVSHNISKIDRKVVEHGSFEDVLDDLGNTNPQRSGQEKRDFFKNKVFEIQELVDNWDPNTASRELRDRICEILMIQSPDDLLKQITANNPPHIDDK